MASVNLRLTLQRAVIERIIAEFTKALEQLRTGSPQRILVVDSVGTLDHGDWANELHPTPAGFDKIAQAWKPYLTAAWLA